MSPSVLGKKGSGDDTYVRVRMVARSRRDERCQMNLAPLVIAVRLLIYPVTAPGHELTGAPSVADSGTIAYVRVKANRIGINSDTIDVVTPHARSDSAESGIHYADHYRHAVIGGFFGGLGGAAIGAGVGAIADARADEVMIPATAIGAIYGAIGGLVLGLLIGVAWPVK